MWLPSIYFAPCQTHVLGIECASIQESVSFLPDISFFQGIN